jgi:hypothetical protein
MKLNQLTRGLFAYRLAPTVLFAILSVGGAETYAAPVLSAGHNVPAQSQTNNSAQLTSGSVKLSPSELLDRVRISAELVVVNLSNFACSEQIDRYRGSAHHAAGHKVDVITTRVSYSNESEHYSDVHQNSKPLHQIAGISGAWSAGEYGTILRETVKALRSRSIQFVSFSTLEGKTAAVYRFDYTAQDSPWDISVSGVHYPLPFHGQVWASPTTGDILRIDRIAYEVPVETGISAVNWAVMFGPSQADGKTYLLPMKGVYSVSYLNSDRHEWNEIAFSDYKRFSSDVVVHFR